MDCMLMTCKALCLLRAGKLEIDEVADAQVGED